MTGRQLAIGLVAVLVAWHLAARAGLVRRGCPFLRAIGADPSPITHTAPDTRRPCPCAH